MNCQQARQLIEAHFDGELDLLRRLEIEEHLAQCQECAAISESLAGLREALSSPSLYHRAPAALLSRIRPISPAAPSPRRWSYRQLAAVAAGVLLLIGAAFPWLRSWSAPGRPERLAEWVVSAHIRSLQADHLTDVASSDRHTVKPWFAGKLDFAPQVVDLAGEGYPLSGGRLDYFADRAVAALVYHRRMHAINLFVWPSQKDARTPMATGSRQGFNYCFWQQNGMYYWAVSDLSGSELEEFANLVQKQPSTSGS